MSTILLSMSLWLGFLPAIPQQEEALPPPPSVMPEETSPPPLKLEQGTMEEYRLAMHLIDVRGKNAEGAEKLLSLVDRADVIAMPGQASWLMTQASRALTLAGKTEEAKKLLPGIRNGSRGTAFEGAVHSQLSRFGPNQYGIDSSFLKYLLSRGGDRGTTFQYLHSTFGRRLLPYFQYIVENPNQEYDLGLRKGAAGNLFCLLNKNMGDWFFQYLIRADDITQKMLISGLNRDLGQNRYLNFVDVEAQREAARLVIALAEHSSPEESWSPVQVLWNFLVWPKPSGEGGDGVVWKQALDKFEDEFISLPLEKMYEYSTILSSVVYAQEDRFLPTLRRLANSEVPEIRKAVRWSYWRKDQGVNLLSEWASGGDDRDLIQFSLMHPFIASNANDEASQAMQRWRRTFFPFDESPYNRQRRVQVRDVSESDFRLLESCSASSHPLVRFQAASALVAYRHTEQGIRFLENLGPDPTWALHLLNTWRGEDLSPEEVRLLLQHGIGTPIEQEVKNLISEKGREGITVQIWRDYGLEIVPGGVSNLLNDLRNAKDAEGLAWIVKESNWPETYLAGPFQYLKQINPARALATLEEISPDNRKELILRFEGRDWERTLEGNRDTGFLQEHLDILRASIAEAIAVLGHSNGLLPVVANADPDLALELILNSKSPSILAKELLSARVNIRANTFLLQKKFLEEIVPSLAVNDLPGMSANLLDLCLVTRVPHADLMRILWSRQGDNFAYDKKLISFILRDSDLRAAFHQELVSLLKEKQFISEIASGLEEEDAVSEFIDPLLEVGKPSLPKSDLARVLGVLGTVDDERVIDALLQFTSDSRADVRRMAMSRLSSLQQSRELQKKWSAWADGQEETSVLLALLEDLKDPDMTVRLGAVKALGLLGDPEALPVLVDLLREDNPIKHAAEEALERMSTPKSD